MPVDRINGATPTTEQKNLINTKDMINAYKYTIRSHLGKGDHFGHFQIRRYITDAKQGEIVEYINPELFNITFKNCKLHNKTSQSDKILKGENKKPCAWLIAESYEVNNSSFINSVEVAFNPRKSKNWTVLNNTEILKSNADNETFKKITTHKNKLFI